MILNLNYKIKINCRVWVLLSFIYTSRAAAQDLRVVDKPKTYRQQVKKDSLQKMVELRTAVPGIIYDLRYSTENNFTATRLYPPVNNTFLRWSPAMALNRAAAELNAMGIGIKVFDAYRPYKATKKMWDLVKDERYVANPAKGSGHNRGISIDLTLVRLDTGAELDMGTGFDHFSDTAHHDFTALNGTILENRKLLKNTMEKFGFRALDTEWWHYSWPNDRQYEVLNLSFRQLAKEHD